MKSLSLSWFSWGYILGNSDESLSNNFNLMPILWLFRIRLRSCID